MVKLEIEYAPTPQKNAIKESVQAGLRRNIRRILRESGYPPDLQETAVDTVIEQAKLLAEDLIENG
jgi:type I restriction enzyme R subunit